MIQECEKVKHHEGSTGRFGKLRGAATFLVGAAVVVSAYWNVAANYVTAGSLWQRDADESVVMERRLEPIRINLRSFGYKGEIGFITNTDLRGGIPWQPEDDKRWGQTQYALIPWRLLHGRRDTPYVIGSFWDGPPVHALEGYTPVYDTGDGLILFRANAK